MIACPTCGGSTWYVPGTVEVEVLWDSAVDDDTAIRSVRVFREEDDDGHDRVFLVHGEPDARCAGCHAKLLDWSASKEDEAAWNAYADARLPAWDLLIEQVHDRPLPEPRTWTSTLTVPAATTVSRSTNHEGATMHDETQPDEAAEPAEGTEADTGTAEGDGAEGTEGGEGEAGE